VSASVRTGRPVVALVAERERVLGGFLEREQHRLARACHDLARSFSRGGTLLAWGEGAAATDAAHVAVEFMHPVVVGKRALPALAGPDPLALARGDDVALAIAHGPAGPREEAFLAEARRRGLLTIALTASGAAPAAADHAFAVDSDDPHVVQEVQETAYHVLWELVHTFFEHPGLLDDACITCGDVAVEARVVSARGATALVEREGAREEVAVDLVAPVSAGDLLLCHAGVALERLEAAPAPAAQAAPDPTSFLYPFLDSSERDLDAVMADVGASTVRKGREVMQLRATLDHEAVERCAADLGDRLRAGGRLVAFGNGGSSTDAQDLAIDALALGWPAIALDDDVATVTAVANDVGFDKVFSRQLIALGRAGDVAVGISTSGSSANVVAGLEEAHRRGMLTCAITGGDGGRLAQLGWIDHLFVAGSDYVPRLQEAHATIYHLLLALVDGRR
jgi:D-sedoheptulose 7-phosphate isomerase